MAISNRPLAFGYWFMNLRDDPIHFWIFNPAISAIMAIPLGLALSLSILRPGRTNT